MFQKSRNLKNPKLFQSTKTSPYKSCGDYDLEDEDPDLIRKAPAGCGVGMAISLRFSK